MPISLTSTQMMLRDAGLLTCTVSEAREPLRSSLSLEMMIGYAWGKMLTSMDSVFQWQLLGKRNDVWSFVECLLISVQCSEVIQNEMVSRSINMLGMW